MLPPIKKPNDIKSSASDNETEDVEENQESIRDNLITKYNIKKIWMDEKAAESIEKDIYHSIEFRLSEIEKIIDKLDKDFGIDNQNLFHYLRNKSYHLNRLRISVGLHEIKAAKTVRDAMKIIKFNLNLVKKMEKEKLEAIRKHEEVQEKELMKYIEENFVDESNLKLPDINQKDDTESTVSSENLPNANNEVNNNPNPNNQLQQQAIQPQQPQQLQTNQEQSKTNSQPNNKPIEVPKIVEEPAEEEYDEEAEKKRKEKALKKTVSINISQSLNYITKKKKPTVEKDIDQITSDDLITPLLKAAKRNFIPVNKETECDSQILDNVFKKTIEFLKDFSHLIDNIEIINQTCDKYFCSFIEESYDSFQEEEAIGLSRKNFDLSKSLLDSALKYQERRKKYFKLIRKNIKNLRILTEKFDDGTTEGVGVDDFSEETKKLSDRYDCDLIQLILIIPDNSLLLRSCIHTIREWIDYDRSYPSYILSDMKETDKKKKNLNSLKHANELINNQLLYRIRMLKQSMDQLELDMNDTFKKKYSQYDDEEDVLINQNVLDRKLNKYKLLRYAPMDCRMMLDTFDLDITSQEHEVNKEVQFLKTLPTNHKLNLFEVDEKFKHVEKLKKKIYELEDYLIYLYQEKKIKQNELDVLENCYVKLKEIYINKISTETLEKIFYGLPLPSFKLVSNNNNNNNNNNMLSEKNAAKDSSTALATLVFNNSYGNCFKKKIIKITYIFSDFY
jgi:hypothetical protein